MQRLIAVAALAALAPLSSADVVTLDAVKDNTMYSEGNESNGAGDYMFAGTNGLSQKRRALIQFDPAASIPAGATIVAVELKLHMSKTVAGPVDISLYRALEAWGEAGSNATSGEGAGAPAQTGDCTWPRRIFPSQVWTTPGGTFVPTPSATTTVDQVADYFFGPTNEMRLDVQGWLDTPATNFGWVIVAQDEVSSPTAKRFDTRNNFSPLVRPKLTITYTLPGCGSASSYCTAAPNSTGFGALIGQTGSLSVAANTFTLTCVQLPPNSSHLFYFGPNQISTPFGNGFRCVGGSVTRLNPPVVASSAGTTSRFVDFTTGAAAGVITAGSTWNFQCWYRNPLAGGAGFNLSDGLSVTFCN